VPELPALCGPVEVTRSVRITDVAGDEIVLVLEDGSPFAVAQVPSAPAVDTSKAVITAATPDAQSATITAAGSGGDGDRARSDATRRGLVLLFASSPELSWTNLPVKPLMVPLFQEAVRMGLELSRGSDRTLVGEPLRAPPGMFRLTGVDRASSSIETGPSGVSREPVTAAGVWSSDEGAIVAANVAEESIGTAPNALEAVRAAFASFGGVRVAREGAERSAARAVATRSSVLSFALLVAALVALLIEGVLSRIFSHASMMRAGGRDGGIVAVGRVRRMGGVRAGSRERETVGAGGAA
jgi:hypothetical protein